VLTVLVLCGCTQSTRLNDSDRSAGAGAENKSRNVPTTGPEYRHEMSSIAGAIALTGTIGVGKTTLAEAISEELHDRGIRHALIDLDWLGQVYPTPEGHDPYSYQLALQNLKEVWPNFQAVGAERVVVAGTLLNEDHRDRLSGALNLPLSVVLLEAPQEILEARIKQRNSGRLQKDFLARTGQVAADIKAANIHDLLVANHGHDPRGISLDVLKLVGWLRDD
jgi:adenylylsulfate kinase